MLNVENENNLKAHCRTVGELIETFQSALTGLSVDEAQSRLRTCGANVFPFKPPLTVYCIFFRQFLNPLIYILVIAAAVSVFLGDVTDGFFIAAVLLSNALIGTVQEHGSEKSARALRQMSVAKTMVERDGEIFEINSEALVPGDIVLLESGHKVPADLRLITTHSLEVDESLLTGESAPVTKHPEPLEDGDLSLADRLNLAFAGSLIIRGRGKGLVVSTGFKTELGKIASELTFGESARPPLLIRMDQLTKRIAIFLPAVSGIIAVALLVRGQNWYEVLMFSVALAVSAIPEGLPVALTVALAIASRRMAKRNVIVRELPAVEALGSCNFIATDKTGTLTANQLTIQTIALAEQIYLTVEGAGLEPQGRIQSLNEINSDRLFEALSPLATAGILCNEAQLAQKNGSWVGYGDAVDLAFLVLAHKLQIRVNEVQDSFDLIQAVPYEPENQFAATMHNRNQENLISVKGAFEKIAPMCRWMDTNQGLKDFGIEGLARQVDHLAEQGFRVMALAKSTSGNSQIPLETQLHDLIFLGLVGMIDPLRPEAADSIASCQRAGITVAMITGDHPKTSLAIARQLGLAQDISEVVSGPQLKKADATEKKKCLEQARVFARVEPQQKLEIVRYLLGQGRFVAVTGDGANDAPALKAANVGVAMGKSGSDVAKEAADLIITDDRFASIIAGVEEGRVAYSNVRKVVYLLLSTGLAEILMFILSLIFQTPMPLTAVQLLWLNLVTNGIQDVGLAFEPGEGDELTKPPRNPNESVTNRSMMERSILSGVVIGGLSFWQFFNFMKSGVSLQEAQNLTLLLMVLFENVMVGNCRSETKSAFSLSPFRNPVLLVGTLLAQGLHIAAMYIPGLKDVLGISPVSLSGWTQLLLLSLSVLLIMEIYKFFRSRVQI